MTDITSFVTDNLVWILVGIVVILLAIIGRYADKTDFGECCIKFLLVVRR